MSRMGIAGGRRLFKLSLGLVAVLMVISLGVTIRSMSHQHGMEEPSQPGSQSAVAQAWIETARLQALLQNYRADITTTEAVRTQFETLADGIMMLATEPPPALSPGAVAPPPMAQVLLPMGQQIDRLLAGDITALPGLLATMNILDTRLQEADARSQRASQGTASLYVQHLLTRHWAVPASTLGLFLAVGLLVALLRAESHRARDSLAQADQAAARQREAERTLRVLIDSLPVMVSAFDTEGRYLFMNEAHARFHRVLEAAAIGHRPAELGLVVGGLDRLPRALASGAPLPVTEGCFADSTGRRHSLLMTAAPVLEGDGKPARVVLIAFDITERKRAEDRVRHLAEHDPLTDLPNRVLFTDRLRQSLARAEAQIAAGWPAGFALHCIDLDRFKDVNDSLGHPIGDRLLVAAAERMRNCLRQVDLLARLGGDEFAVIQADASSPAEAMRLSNRLVRVLEAPFEIDGFTIPAGASIGTVLAPRDGHSSQALQQHGDIALYRAKAEGRGRAVLFTPEMGAELAERRLLEAELRHVLEGDGLTLAYQPQFCLASGRVLGCEALLRWNHPKRGAIPPARFVPLAEEAGLATALSRWVLRHACAQIRAWQSEGLQIAVAVNLSARHFGSDQALRLVEEALRDSGIPAALLEIEVTENVFIRNAAAAREALDGLHARGVRVALDDFGTGYSSLSYLRHLPFDVLKIDRAFMRDLQIGESSGRIVETIIGLAHALDAKVVAEGVETPEQLAVLRQLGCDAVQGFLLGRPMAPDALAALIRGQPGTLRPQPGEAAA